MTPITDEDRAKAREMALAALDRQNPRFTLYRNQDPTFRESDVNFWAGEFERVITDSRAAEASATVDKDASWISDPPHVAGIYWMRNWLEDDAKYVYRIVEITWIEDYWGGRWMRKGWYLLTIYDRNNYPETVEEFVGGMEKVAFQGPIHPQE